MKFQFRNLGVQSQTELELGDLTIISGENNSGKTYVAYAVYGFLLTWRRFINLEPFAADIAKEFDIETELNIPHEEIVKELKSAFEECISEYNDYLWRVLAADQDKLHDTELSINLINWDDFELPKVGASQHISGNSYVNISSAWDRGTLDMRYLAPNDEKAPPLNELRYILSFYLDLVFKDYLGEVIPNVFIASAERTGATIFSRELDLAKNRLIERLGDEDGKGEEVINKMREVATDYALPVKENINFIRDIERLSKKTSRLVEKHPDILTYFEDVIGGKYESVEGKGTYYVPEHSQKVQLSMGESSSAVRSMLNIGAYIKHKANEGDLLIIDEPELNLHPKNQRKMARLIARLVNAGVKVFITTHSDYIIRELNTLIMLRQEQPHLRQVQKAEGYRDEELLSPSQIKAYQATKKNGKGMTLLPIEIDPEYGIGIESFDTEIDDMERVQSMIMYGMPDELEAIREKV